MQKAGGLFRGIHHLELPNVKGIHRGQIDAALIFHPLHSTSNTAREFLSQISGIQIAPEASDLEKLTLFMEAARKLNTIGVLDEILVTLLDATLKLTRAERCKFHWRTF